MNIVVIGSDVSGLLAAFVAERTVKIKNRPKIVAIYQPHDVIAIAPHLNELLPVNTVAATLPIPQHHMRFIAIGPEQDWPAKIEAKTHLFPTSHIGPGHAICYDALDVFNYLQRMYVTKTFVWSRTSLSLGHLIDAHHADLVINTSRREIFCQKPDDHFFGRRQIMASNQHAPSSLEDNVVETNSGETPAWHKTSKVAGRTVTEWVKAPPFSGMFPVGFPVRTTCDCEIPRVVHVGPEALYRPQQRLGSIPLAVEQALVTP